MLHGEVHWAQIIIIIINVHELRLELFPGKFFTFHSGATPESKLSVSIPLLNFLAIW